MRPDRAKAPKPITCFRDTSNGKPSISFIFGVSSRKVPRSLYYVWPRRKATIDDSSGLENFLISLVFYVDCELVVAFE